MIPTKVLKGSSIFSVKALENVKNVLENTLEKSLNFFMSRCGNPVYNTVLITLDQPKCAHERT